MNDLISRQAAIEALGEEPLVWTDADEELATRSQWEKDVNAIKAVPSAEPKKGEWVHDGLDFSHGVDWIHCSVCGRKGINVPADLTKFCPHCGAKMGVEK